MLRLVLESGLWNFSDKHLSATDYKGEFVMNCLRFGRTVVLAAFVLAIMLVPATGGNIAGTDGVTIGMTLGDMEREL